MMPTTNSFTESILKILQWIADNLNWVAPLFITFLFSCLNLHMAKVNSNAIKKQNKMQNDAFCYQLFDRRLRVYTNIKKILSQVIRDGQVSNEVVNKYVADTRETVMLFGQEVVQKVDEIRKLLENFHVITAKVKYNIGHSAVHDSNHSALCDQESKLLTKITDENMNLIDTFESYISFKDYKIEPIEKVEK